MSQQKNISTLNIALVHDWLNGMRGGEKVLEQLCVLFPKAHIYTLHSDLDKISNPINLYPYSNIRNLTNLIPAKIKSCCRKK